MKSLLLSCNRNIFLQKLLKEKKFLQSWQHWTCSYVEILYKNDNISEVWIESENSNNKLAPNTK